MDMTTPDWSSLPDHVLASIAKHLQTPIDTLCFRAVCNSFRYSIPPPPKLLSPRPDLKIPIPSPTSRRGHLVLAEFTFFAVEPLTKISDPYQTETWVVKMEELNSGKVRLEDPLSRLRLGNLSNKIPNFEKLPESLNLLDYRVKEVAKSFRLEMVAQGKGINRKKPVVYSKAVVCTYQDETDDGFAFMAIIEGGDQLGVWRNVDKKWSIIDMGYDSFVDIIHHRRKFYAMMCTGLTITVDPKSLIVTQVASPPQSWSFGERYLVNSLKDLFVIVKKCVWQLRPPDFKVYKLDEERCEWVEVVDGLEDRVFFLGNDCSFSLSDKEFCGCKGDCIYFKHDPFKVDSCHPGTDGGILDLKNDIIDRLSSFPSHSKIFWPPPTWLKNQS